MSSSATACSTLPVNEESHDNWVHSDNETQAGVSVGGRGYYCESCCHDSGCNIATEKIHYLYVHCKVINFEIKCNVFLDPGVCLSWLHTCNGVSIQWTLYRSFRKGRRTNELQVKIINTNYSFSFLFYALTSKLVWQLVYVSTSTWRLKVPFQSLSLNYKSIS